jgi:hypothetical protein
MGGSANKLLERMKNNPKSDWTIDDVERVCRLFEGYGVVLHPPTRGSHYTVSNPYSPKILTIPAHGHVKPVYIRALISILDDIRDQASLLRESNQEAPRVSGVKK